MHGKVVFFWHSGGALGRGADGDSGVYDVVRIRYIIALLNRVFETRTCADETGTWRMHQIQDLRTNRFMIYSSGERISESHPLESHKPT